MSDEPEEPFDLQGTRAALDVMHDLMSKLRRYVEWDADELPDDLYAITERMAEHFDELEEAVADFENTFSDDHWWPATPAGKKEAGDAPP